MAAAVDTRQSPRLLAEAQRLLQNFAGLKQRYASYRKQTAPVADVLIPASPSHGPAMEPTPAPIVVNDASPPSQVASSGLTREDVELIRGLRWQGEAALDADALSSSTHHLPAYGDEAETSLRSFFPSQGSPMQYQERSLEMRDVDRHQAPQHLDRWRAAVRIQAAWRGYHTRTRDRRVLAMRREIRLQRMENHILATEERCTRYDELATFLPLIHSAACTGTTCACQLMTTRIDSLENERDWIATQWRQQSLQLAELRHEVHGALVYQP
ncbi:uncharacterized protein MONBRDRAFT_38901 [Monosiga brevicollis MX1]|uniref:Uncharacterized protein n=1 Tax=Monosiga brevicollis TaxID=81824 RepID=A9VAV4_MONBE|nr:uncharacterized protein MONBRDRAFT_38901 [Monosiga brevicollis MX1]EDQ85441.1 predicted protein [Monosiga brevicollis MX1]|eukprot:XP_001749852.1 hypothetical protein [Monosiga brevicollis MX1]